MAVRMREMSPNLIARIAGGLYLIVILGGFFAEGFIPATIIVSGDAAATARNILANELLYRSGIVAHLIILVCNMPLAVIFYDLFKVVNRRCALLVVFFTLVGTTIEAANLLTQFAPLVLLQGTHSASALPAEQVAMILQLQAIGFNIVLTFFAFYGFAIGYVVFKSNFLPRSIGVLLIIGGLSYLINSLASFLAPEFATRLFPYIQIPNLIAEGSLCVWLLVRGVNVSRWEQQASIANRTNAGVSANVAI